MLGMIDLGNSVWFGLWPRYDQHVRRVLPDCAKPIALLCCAVLAVDGRRRKNVPALELGVLVV